MSTSDRRAFLPAIVTRDGNPSLLKAAGIDPIWFGVMLVTVCEIGMIVPPVGMNLFVVQRVGGLDLRTVVSGIVPFAAADAVRLLILCLLPGLATWLPHAFG